MVRVDEAAAPPQPSGLGRLGWQHFGWAVLLVLGVVLWGPILAALWHLWMRESTLSHGPVVLALAVGHLWLRREDLREWQAASPAGLLCLLVMTLVHVGAYFADVVFLKSFSLLGMTAGAIWFLGGWKALKASIGALGFLAFAIPWPTTLSERIAFPLQLLSSTYGAMLTGILGVPVVREGVHLAVLPDPAAKPIYSVLVAQECSGLTSLIVLLSLAYLIAYHTPIGLGWRALMVAFMVPLTLLANSVRITLILLAGAYYNPDLATWVHDHEAPVLIFFCSLGLMGLRQALLAWRRPGASVEEGAVA